jgi:transcription termination factor Rho
MAQLEDAHLSDLHSLAAGAGVERYRMLARPDLLAALRERGVEEAPERRPARREPREARQGGRGDGGRGRGGGRGGRAGDGRRGRQGEGRGGRQGAGRRERERREEGEVEDEQGVPVTGVLDVMPQRYGFIRLQDADADEADVYISASQIRRCELRSGDEVSGPAREPRRGERHRALIHVDAVNGVPLAEGGRPDFEALTPVPPTRRLPLESLPEGDAGLLVRAADLLAPLAFGQRVLVSAAPRSGRTTFLRGLATAIDAAEGPEVVVLLIDERPEEATRWRRALPDAELAIATAEMSPAEQARTAEMAMARAKRLVEAGGDAVLVVDSLSRLAAARGGIDAAKAVFGAGRELEEEEAGSLTVVATVLGDDEVSEAVVTTESALVALDPDLAADGVVPALDPVRTRVSGEEELREPAEVEAARRLRSLLSDLEPTEAARLLRERIEGSRSNSELLASI